MAKATTPTTARNLNIQVPGAPQADANVANSETEGAKTETETPNTATLNEADNPETGADHADRLESELAAKDAENAALREQLAALQASQEVRTETAAAPAKSNPMKSTAPVLTKDGWLVPAPQEK